MFRNAALTAFLRWYGAANTSSSVSARMAGPRSIGAITRPFGNRLREATSDMLWHDGASTIVCGLKNASISGFARNPAAANPIGDATTDRKSNRPETSPGHRTVRLAANKGAATIDAPAAPRTSQKRTPISEASVTMPTIQRNRSAAGERRSAAAAKPIVLIGK